MTMSRVLYFEDDQRIDEMVGQGFYHLEQMDDNAYYLGFQTPEGEMVQLSIRAQGPIRVECYSHGRDDWPSSVELQRIRSGGGHERTRLGGPEA